MEHGHIIISYNLVTREEIEQLRTVLQGVNLYDEWGADPLIQQDPRGHCCINEMGGGDADYARDTL